MALEPEIASRRHAAQSRTRRHDAAVLDRPRAHRAGRSCWRWAGIWSAVTAASTQTLSNWIQLVLATPVVLWAGWPFFVRGWQSLLTRNLNMFTLIAMGTGVAWLYSVVAHPRAAAFSRQRSAAMTARSRSISRPPPSSPCWFCSARCWNCARARRPPAPSRRCSISRRRPRAASATTAATRRSRSTARGRRQLARAARREGAGRRRSARGPLRRSMNRWSPANPCRSPRRPAPR